MLSKYNQIISILLTIIRLPQTYENVFEERLFRGNAFQIKSGVVLLTMMADS
jgi:hypothetical protein